MIVLNEEVYDSQSGKMNHLKLAKVMLHMNYNRAPSL